MVHNSSLATVVKLFCYFVFLLEVSFLTLFIFFSKRSAGRHSLGTVVGLHSPYEVEHFVDVDALRVQRGGPAARVHVLVVAVHVHGAEERVRALPLHGEALDPCDQCYVKRAQICKGNYGYSKGGEKF